MIDVVIFIVGRISSALIELRHLRQTVRCLSIENHELRERLKEQK